MKKEMTFKADLDNLDTDQRLAYGWFNVMTRDGEPVEDRQGDTIEPDVMAKAAREFIKGSREGHYRHEGKPIASVVESLVLTKEVQKYLGCNLNLEGWFGALEIHDDGVWKKVKEGETLGLSIGGTSEVEEVIDE